MKTTLFLAFGFSLAASVAIAEPEIMFDENPKTIFRLNGKYGGVHIAANRDRVRIGDEFTVRMSFANLGDEPLALFDTTRIIFAGHYLKLELFNAQHEYVGDLLLQLFGTHGSRTLRPNHGLWCQIPPNDEYVIRRRFTAGSVKLDASVHLPPGRYSIQLVVYGRFFSDSPWELPCPDCGVDKNSREYEEYLRRFVEAAGERQQMTSEEREEAVQARIKKWRNKNFGGELVRSNVLSITFLPRPVEAPKP